MNDCETSIKRDDGKNKYRVRWVERHEVSTIIYADSAEEALGIAKDEDSDEFLDVANIDAYGPADPESYEVELIDDSL